MEAEQVSLGGEIRFNFLSRFLNVKELDLSNVTGVKGRSLEGLETLTDLERVVLTSSWEAKNEGMGDVEWRLFQVRFKS